jgi:hypothetical protein
MATEPDARSRDVTTQLETIAQSLDHISEQIASLERESSDLATTDLCTGVAYWRDRSSGEVPAKMYANHSVDGACPLHGSPQVGKRLRVYIGTDASAQAAVLVAMERRREKMEIDSRIGRLERKRNAILEAISRAHELAKA